MAVEIRKMRRLSIFFANGEALSIELEPLDIWDSVALRVSKNTETIQFLSHAVAYWRLLTYEKTIDLNPPPRPVKEPLPELDLR